MAKQKEISFFHSVIKQTMDHRAKNKVRRNDFVDLMLDAMRGEAGKEENEEDKERDSDLTDQIESDGKLAHKVSNRWKILEANPFPPKNKINCVGNILTSSRLLAAP